MPDLPTLTVTNAQATRMLAAFGSAAEYREWLRATIVDHVQRFELRAIDAQADVAKRAALDDVAAALLPTPPPT